MCDVYYVRLSSFDIRVSFDAKLHGLRLSNRLILLRGARVIRLCDMLV